jgi:hypothetical protein
VWITLPSGTMANVLCFYTFGDKTARLIMAPLYGTSKYTWKEREVELAGLPEDTVVKAVTIFVYLQTKKLQKDNFFLTVVLCILILSKFFVYQLIHNRVALKEY